MLFPVLTRQWHTGMLFTTPHLSRCKLEPLLKMSALFLLLLLAAAGPVDRQREFFSELEILFDNEGEDVETPDYGESDRVDTDLVEEPVSSSTIGVEPLTEDEYMDTKQMAVEVGRDSLGYKSSILFQEDFNEDIVKSMKTLDDFDSVSKEFIIDSDQYADDPSAGARPGTQGPGYRRIRSVLLTDDDDSLDKHDVVSTPSNLDNTIEAFSRNHNFSVVPRFDPWVFETKMDVNPDISVRRLYLVSSEIEEYAERVARKDRQHNVTYNVMDVKYTHPIDVYSSASQRTDAADDSRVPRAPPTLDCHFLWAYKKQWVRLVATCPQMWEDDTARRQCVDGVVHVGENVIDVLSLPVQDNDGVVYKNVFCAECNNAIQTETWDISMHCDGATSVVFINGNVALSLMPELSKSPHCRHTLLPSQPIKVEKCHSIMRRSTVHGNEYSGNSFKSETYPVSFSLLMNFGFDGKTHILFKSRSQVVVSYTGNTCLERHQIWDSVSGRCRTIVCLAGYSLIDNICIKDPIPSEPFRNDLTINTVTTLTDVAVIRLYVNTSSNRLSPDLKIVLIEGIATLLNISSGRIQNLTIVKVNGTYPHGPQVEIRPLDHDKDFPSEEDDAQWTEANEATAYKPILDNVLNRLTDTNVKSSLLYRRRGRKRNMNETHQKKRHPKTERRTVASLFYETTAPSFGHHKKDFSSKHTLPEKNETVTFMIKFLLLPARFSTLHEGTALNVREKIDSLFQQHKLHLTLNGTTLTLLDMNNFDKHSNRDDTFCPRGMYRQYYANEVDIITATTKSGNISSVHLFVNSTNSIYGPGKYEVTFWLRGKVGVDVNTNDTMDFALVCEMPKIVHSDCTRYEFVVNDYTLLPNRSIVLSNILYNTSEYEYSDETSGTIEICVPDSDLHPAPIAMSYLVVHGCVQGFEKFLMASAYMTAILGRISIVALAIVFVTYCLLPQLRNLPGVNTMNLTLSLLIAESVFMLGEGSVDIPWVCSLVSILLHYFFLASFFWMNVMSFDVFRTFANDTCALPHIREKSKHLLKYVLYSWGSPAVIVGVCVLLDFTKVIPSVDIGYGRHHSEKGEERNAAINESNSLNKSTTPDNVSFGCWIQNPVATLAAFGAPIVLILIVNIYLFVKTILCIRKTAKFTSDNTRRSNLNRHNGRNDVILYVRMSTVMGFTWLFGLASSVISAITTTSSDFICYTEHIIGLLFVIFNCSQGLFIFFAFVTKKRVFFLYKILWTRTRQRIIRRRLNRQRYISNSGSNSSHGSTTTVSTITSMNPGFTSNDHTRN